MKRFVAAALLALVGVGVSSPGPRAELTVEPMKALSAGTRGGCLSENSRSSRKKARFSGTCSQAWARPNNMPARTGSTSPNSGCDWPSRQSPGQPR